MFVRHIMLFTQEIKMKNQLTIHKATPNHRTSIQKLWKTVLEHTFEAEKPDLHHNAKDELAFKMGQLDAAFENAFTQYFVAYYKQQLVGTIAYETPPNRGILKRTNDELSHMVEIGSLYIKPSFQKRGFGTQLIYFVLETLLDQGVKTVCFDSIIDTSKQIWRRIFGEPKYLIPSKKHDFTHMIWVVDVQAVLNRLAFKNQNTKCIMIEGLPGSGKTTFSKRLQKHFQSKKQRVVRYSEGDLHPLDLAWCAIVDEKTFEALCEKYDEVVEDIKKNTTAEDGMYIVAYTQVKLPNHYKTFLDDFGRYEIYRSHALSTFKSAHIKRWKQFAKNLQPNTIYVFECVFLQNHVNELLLKYGLDHEEMIDYFNELLEALLPLKPHVVYIEQCDVKDRITFIANQRKTNNRELYKDWIEYVIDYFHRQPLSKEKGYLGLTGAFQYFETRQSVELSILPKLNTPSKVVTLNNDYDKVFEQVSHYLEKNI